MVLSDTQPPVPWRREIKSHARFRPALTVERDTTAARTLGTAALGAALLLVVLDAIWLGLNALDQTTTGVVVAVVLATIVGATVGGMAIRT